MELKLVKDGGPTPRLRECVEAWPDCAEGDYDPSCCRFPKSCSCTVYDENRVTDADLELAESHVLKLDETTNQIMATFSDGSQVLVWLWSTGEIQVAKREEAGDTWGPPAEGKVSQS